MWRCRTTTGDVKFTLDFDGSRGPDEGEFKALSEELSVTVEEARAGSGRAVAMATGDGVIANTTGNEVVITYTAIGEIGEEKQITVEVPAGWSAPLNEEADDDMMGTFTVAHLLKLADDDADGERDAGDALAAAAVVKAAGAGDDDPAMIMVAEVELAKTLAAGDSVVFTYTNAKSPEMPTADSYFTTTYGVEVEDSDVKVIVESGKPASALAIVVDGFTIEDGPATVTVKLLDPDGELATRSTPTTVDLIASSGTIVSVTIPAGEYSMDTTLSAEEAANITITATATGLTDAEPLTVLADTNSPSIDADSITADPMYAKEGTTVTVSATGTKARAANTVLFSIHTGETPGPVADGNDGRG